MAVFTVGLLLTGCARSAPILGADGIQPLPVTAAATTPPTTAPQPSITPTAPAEPAPTASPTPTRPPAPVDPLAGLSAATRRAFRPCLARTVRPGGGGTCAVLAQRKLKAAGFHPWRVSSRITTAGANALLNYQRSRGLKATATTTKATWLALAHKSPAVPSVLPKKCLQPKGVLLCVDQAHRRLSWMRNGKVVKTFRVRLGGWNYHPKTKKWKVFATANGTWHVYDKLVDPPSENYGSGAMPYSTIFYPDMYVHYSPVFNRVGYATSSHGCVNIARLSDAMWIFRHTPIGATVHIFSPKAAN